MAILVTGGAGFIGSNLVCRLARRSERVVVIDDFNDYYSPALKRANAALAREAGSVTFVEGDIRDRKVVESALDAGASSIIHLAARAGVRPSLEDPALYIDVNIQGTLNLLEAARLRGVRRFVFASSSSVYGASTAVPFAETAIADSPESPYGASKRGAEVLVSAYHNLYGLATVSLRFFTVYGPRQRPDMAIHKFARLIAAGRKVPFFGDGSSARDYTFIEDIVDGVVAAHDSALEHETINLGDSKPVTLAQMVSTIASALGKEAVLDRQDDQPGDVPVTYADISKARAMLGYSPKVPFEEGIRRFVEWYLKAKAQGVVE